jgi:hypothetical protein
LVYNFSLQLYVDHLIHVIETLNANQLYANRSKYMFGE